MDTETREMLISWADKYNDRQYFREDPIAFPTRMAELYRRGERSLADVEITALIAAHLAWGRRAMIVRDSTRAMEEMDWRPYDYVMKGAYRNDGASLHRTVKWSEFADICSRLREIFSERESIEGMDNGEIRCRIFGRKADPKAPSDKSALLIPLDVHVHDEAVALGLTQRRQKDITTVKEITGAFAEIFPGDPCKGDFALFGYGITYHK